MNSVLSTGKKKTSFDLFFPFKFASFEINIKKENQTSFFFVACRLHCVAQSENQRSTKIARSKLSHINRCVPEAIHCFLFVFHRTIIPNLKRIVP
jgi:hypothetical protein